MNQIKREDIQVGACIVLMKHEEIRLLLLSLLLDLVTAVSAGASIGLLFNSKPVNALFAMAVGWVAQKTVKLFVEQSGE